MAVQLKSKADIEKLRRANMIVCEVLDVLQEMVSPGVTSLELDAKAREICIARGARPAFLNYPARSSEVQAFPAVICASRNEAIVHGIPDSVPLVEGDIISVDFGCCLDGFFGDSARTFAIGKISDEAQRLLDVTKQSLDDAIAACIVGNRIGDVGYAVQRRAEQAGFGIVREFVGHGIGQAMHEEPQVPNFGFPGKGRPLRPGLVIAVEPMVTVGNFETKILEDGWTAVTRDGSLSAHFEHSIAITDEGPYVLSRP